MMTDAERKQKQKERDDKRRAYRKAPRQCSVCGAVKPVIEFERHGPRGRKPYCTVCAEENKRKSKQRTNRTYRAKKEVVKRCALTVSEPKSGQEVFGDWRQKFIKEGWRCLGGLGDDQEQITVFIRGWVVMYLRGSKGSYSTGKTSFGVLFDDKQPRITSLGKAEARAKRLYGSSKELSA